MPTQIDSLSIEIKSNSTDAASGIDALARSLGELKKTGSVGVAVKNLNALSAALRNLTSAGTNANKINTLAAALSNLKAVGSVSSVGNNVEKLSNALHNLNAVDLSKLNGVASSGPVFTKVAEALGSLSSIKSGGFGTMVNGLAKIGDVTAKLDEGTIDAFASKVKKLSEVITPLSGKLTTVAAGFSAIGREARHAGSGVSNMSGHLDASAVSLHSYIHIVQTVINALSGVVRLLESAIASAMEWDGIEYQFGNAFGEEADKYYAEITKITDALSINKQMFMENSAMASSMLIGFGVDAKDARKMGVGYTELAYDIWAAYNNVYKTLDGADGAMAAIRSAIAGEVEPIRRAGFTIVDSQLAITAANHGIAYSTQSATEEMKSYLRYLTLVDQAQQKGIVGTYASEMSTAEGMVRAFTQQIKSLAQAFGSLFIPILVRVMPYIQAFVELVTQAVHWLAALFGVKIQAVDFSDYKTGVGGISQELENVEDNAGGATKALKELKNATIGIDELNIISPPEPNKGGSGGAGGGGGGFDGLEVESLWDESIYEGVQSKVEGIKNKIEELKPVIAGVALALGGLALTKLLNDIPLAQSHLEGLRPIITNVGKALGTVGISIAVGALVWDFTGAYLETGDINELLKAIGTTALGTGVAYWLAGGAGASIVLLTSAIVKLTRLAVELAEGTVEFDDPEVLTTALTTVVEGALGGWAFSKTLWPVIKNFATTKLVPWVSGTLLPKLTTLLGGISWPAVGIAALVTAILGYITLGFVDYDFTDFGKKVGTAIGNGVRKSTDFVLALGTAIKDNMVMTWDWLKENITWENITAFIAKMFDPTWWADTVWPFIQDIGKKIAEKIGPYFENLAGNIGEFLSGMLDGFSEATGWDVSWLEFILPQDGTQAVTGTSLPLAIGNLLYNAGKQHGPQLMRGILDAFDSNGLTKKVSEAWENARRWWRDKKKALTTYTPSIGSIAVALSSAWTLGKKWWDKTRGRLSTYTPTIGSVREKLSSAWSSARKWWNTSKAALPKYTPTIGSIRERLSSAWSSARQWWNKSKGTLKYTPSIGSIKSNLSSAWTTARNWWNRSKSGLSYTPSIGSIKSKLVDAWNTAKKWWNNNVRLSIPSLSFKVTYSTSGLGAVKNAIVKALNLPGWPKLSFAANGGIFDAGSLVWAGERGPEVLAKAAGGKTGVMNVEQMQDAVYEGVYAAVMAAMQHGGGSGGSQSVNVYLDGKQITSTVEKRQRERGAAIMGNQVFSY